MSTYPQLLTPAQDTEIARKHLAGTRLADLGREFGVYPSSIRAALRRQGITPNNYTYRFNAQAFDDLGSEVACYWLGFIFADGYTARSGLAINLKRDDAIHLERFRSFLQAEQPLSYNITYAAGRPNQRVALRINDRAFGRKLAAMGITRDRLNPKQHMKLIPDTMLHHWFHFGGVIQCRRIAEYLYRDATIWMDRKRDIIDSWTSQSYLKA
jgi:hypothetical protein